MLLRCLLGAAVACALVASAVPVHAEVASVVRTESFRLLNEGIAAYNKGDYRGAITSLEKSASMALNSFRAHLYLGLARIGDRRYPEAVDALLVALDLEPENLQGLTGLGEAYLRMGDIDESRAAYVRALKERPEFPAALVGIARSFEAQGRDSEAVPFYRRAITANAGFAEAYTQLGELYLRQGRVEEAIDLLAEGVRVRPDYAPGRNRLALAYSRLGLFNEAVATIQSAIALEPNRPEHPTTLGNIQLDLGLVERARESFVRALAIDSSFPGALRGVAEIARREGNYDLAAQHVDLALADPRLDSRERKEFETLRAAIATERERAAVLLAAERAGTATPEQLDELTTLYAGRGMWDRAVDLARRGASPQDQLAYYLLRAGRFREAYDVYVGLLEAEPGRPDLLLNLGIALASLGRDEEAVAAYRAVTDDPEAPDTIQRLGRVYLGNALLRLERDAEAADAYLAFLDGAADGEFAERVRRILERIAPDRVPKPASSPADAAAPPPPQGGTTP